MNKVLPTIQEIQKELNTLAEAKTLAQAQRVILSVIRLLDGSVSLDDSKQFQLFNVDNQKISANAQWFYEDNVMVDRRAIYKIHNDNSLNIDFKLYGITKPSKRTISWIQALTPNFEDEPFNSKFNIGIDFVVPKSVDKVIIVLSNNYVVRTLELKGTLTATFQEILAKWASISDFSNKKEVHSILWESFDLQPLNKKFYAGISERFITLRQYLTKEKILDDKHASLFANRLLGRVIFCWFLDKKGVINPERKYFDSHSFNDDTEYYRKNLENLFFGVLNTPIADREYKDDITPFLNGGLFEARDTDLYKNSKLSFPKNYFDDLFDFLSGYNFTTDESTSQFQQVAIDPEMLGRIFENLLAEMTEETGEQARKAKGAFYTPREIVDYMCRESLREYLKTKIPEDQFRDQRFTQLIDAPDKDFQDQDHNWRRDWKPYKDGIIKALDDLKVLDPACGSGAFPIGMLQLLVRVYERLEPRFDTYKAKLQIIEKNIYGIDIEPMAVEIARLRAWLSIIVDEEADSKKIKPLPNLEFKFICANSLTTLDRSGVTTFGDDPKLGEKLQEIRDSYFNTESPNKKKRLKTEYENLVNKGEGLFGESIKSKQLKTYRPFDNEWSASFFDPEFMFGVKTFDVVTGNPPYVNIFNISDEKYREYLKKNFSVYKNKTDLYAFFVEKGYNLLRNDGFLYFIISNSWLGTDSFSKFREFLISNTKVINLVKCHSNVFEASVTTVILGLKKEKVSDWSIALNKFNQTVEPLGYDLSYSQIRSQPSMGFTFDRVIKILVPTKPLSEICEFSLGIKTSNDSRFLSDEKINAEYKKLLRGKDVDSYKISYAGKYIWYRPDLMMEKTGAGPRRKEVFEAKRKILVKDIASNISATIDHDQYYATDTLSVIYNPKDGYSLEFILGVINSSFIRTWFKTSFPAGLHIKTNQLKQIPIPILDTKKKSHCAKEIESRVVGLLRENNDFDESIKAIDALVEDLYEKQ